MYTLKYEAEISKMSYLQSLVLQYNRSLPAIELGSKSINFSKNGLFTEEDRLNRRRQKLETGKSRQSEVLPSTQHGSQSQKKGTVSQDGGPIRSDRQLTMLSEVSTHSSLASQPFQGPPTPPAVSAVQEEDEEEEFALSEEEDGEELEEGFGEELSMLPWHHEQLYRLYGKDADYFLHPKIEVEKQKVVKTMNPKLRKHGGGVSL